MTRRALTAVALIIAIACGKDRAASPTQPSATPTSPSGTGTISPLARSYLEQIVTLMQNN